MLSAVVCLCRRMTVGERAKVAAGSEIDCVEQVLRIWEWPPRQGLLHFTRCSHGLSLALTIPIGGDPYRYSSLIACYDHRTSSATTKHRISYACFDRFTSTVRAVDLRYAVTICGDDMRRCYAKTVCDEILRGQCVCYPLFNYPATCGPKGRGSGGRPFYTRPYPVPNRPHRF